jgi:hypothetical protein
MLRDSVDRAVKTTNVSILGGVVAAKGILVLVIILQKKAPERPEAQGKRVWCPLSAHARVPCHKHPWLDLRFFFHANQVRPRIRFGQAFAG